MLKKKNLLQLQFTPRNPAQHLLYFRYILNTQKCMFTKRVENIKVQNNFLSNPIIIVPGYSHTETFIDDIILMHTINAVLQSILIYVLKTLLIFNFPLWKYMILTFITFTHQVLSQMFSSLNHTSNWKEKKGSLDIRKFESLDSSFTLNLYQI